MNDLDAIQSFFRLFSEIKIKSEYCFLTKHCSCDISKMVNIYLTMALILPANKEKIHTFYLSGAACLGSLAGSPLDLGGINAIENTKKKSWNKLEFRPFDWQERCYFATPLRQPWNSSGQWGEEGICMQKSNSFIVLWQKQRKRFLLLILEYTMHVIRVHFSGENAFVLN